MNTVPNIEDVLFTDLPPGTFVYVRDSPAFTCINAKDRQRRIGLAVLNAKSNRFIYEYPESAFHVLAVVGDLVIETDLQSIQRSTKVDAAAGVSLFISKKEKQFMLLAGEDPHWHIHMLNLSDGLVHGQSQAHLPSIAHWILKVRLASNDYLTLLEGRV